MAPRHEAGHLHLQALDGAVDEAHGPSARSFLAEHVPRLQRLTQLEMHARVLHLTEDGEAEQALRLEGGRVESVAGPGEVIQHGAEVGRQKMGQHEAIVQPRAPADTTTGLGLAPEPRDQRAQQQLLGEAHPGVRRHLEGAELHEAEAPRGPVRRVELVDADLGPVGVAGDVHQDVAEDPVDEPARDVGRVRLRHLVQRHLQLVEPVVARLVHARGLARRADIEAREQVGEGRVPLPVEHEALQQVGAPQEGRVVGRRAAHHNVVAAAGAGVAPVGHELLGAEPGQARLLVEAGGDRHRLAPGGGRVHVHLDHAGIGRDLHDADARVVGRLVALDVDGLAALGGGRLDVADELEILVDALERGHEHPHHPVAGLDRERGAHRHALDPAAVARGRAARMVGEIAAGLQRVLGLVVGVALGRHVRQRAQRQAEARGRVARHQEGVAAAEVPGLRDPGPLGKAPHREACQRQHVGGRLAEAAGEDPLDPGIVLGRAALGTDRRDVDGQALALLLPVLGVLEGRDDVGAQAEPLGQRLGEAAGLRDGGARARFRRDQVGVRPDRLAVPAPVQTEGPARQALARIPLALAVMQQAARAEAVAQAPDQLVGEVALGRPDRPGVPLLRLEIVDRHEGRLAAHGQAHVLRGEVPVDPLAERVHVGPDAVREGLRHARRLGDAGHAHLEAELGLGGLRETGDRRGRAVVRRRGQRDVALAAEQARGRVEPDPAGPRQVDLRPGVQVGEVRLGALRPLDRGGVGHELDQVAGGEACREAEAAQDLHHQPGRVAAGPGLQGQGLCGALHARLHAHAVGDRVRNRPVQRHEEQHRVGLAPGLLRQRGQEGVELGSLRLVEGEVGRKLGFQVRLVGEGHFLRVVLDEEVERVDHRHLGGEIDLDLQLVGLLREDEAGEPVAVRVLLPVQEMILRRHRQGVGRDLHPRVRRRAQADHLRPEADGPVVAVVRDVVQGGFDRHGQSRLSDSGHERRPIPPRGGATPDDTRGTPQASSVRPRRGSRAAVARPG